MKAGKVLVVMIAALLLLGVAACGRNKVVGENVIYPAWWTQQPDEEFVYAAGMGTKVSQNLSIESARSNALVELARYVKTEVDALTSNFEKETGVFDPQILALVEKVSEATTSAEFSGVITSQIDTRRIMEYGGERFTTYIQLKLPKTAINKQFYDEVVNEEALYNEFRATEAFKRLHKVVEGE